MAESLIKGQRYSKTSKTWETNLPGRGYETAHYAGYAANLNSVVASNATAFCSALT